jgi:deoxyribonuclease V
VLADLPSIGCAKSLLFGQHSEAPEEKGASTPLTHKGELLGAVLRTKLGVKPLYISVGHRISLETALKIVMSCVTKYRLPEPTRLADALASHDKAPTIAPRQGALFRDAKNS